MVMGRSFVHRALRACAPFALALAIVGASSVAHAAPVQQDLEQAEQAYANLDYPEANKFADRVAKQKNLSHDQLVRAYRILALTHAVLDRESAAKDAFILLLTYDPDYQVDPNLGPRVQTPFFEARGFWRAQAGKPGIEAATVLRPKEPGTVRVTTRDPTHVVRRVNVGYRWGGEGEMTVRTVGIGDNVPVEVPAPPSGTTRFDYYAQALDDRENVVFEVGSPQAPKTTTVQAEPARVAAVEGGESKSVFSSPVFWIVTGVVVAGAATTAGYFIFKPEDRVETRILPPQGAALSPVLECGTSRCF